MTRCHSEERGDEGSAFAGGSLVYNDKLRQAWAVSFSIVGNIKMTKRTGFTLIELIVAILILGILAAVAVPRFINLKSQANVAALMGLRAAVISAADLAHGLQVTQGLGSNANVAMEGVPWVAMWLGYPDQQPAGIGKAVQFDSSTFRSNGGWPMIFQVIGATDPNRCQITYVLSAATPTAPPNIVTLVDGC